MRDSGLIDAKFVCDVFLAQILRITKLAKARMDGAVVTFTTKLATLPFHDIKVEYSSTFVKRESSTDLPSTMKRSEGMGDSRHKNSPATDDEEEDVTPQFRAQARAIMRANELANKARKLKPGDDGYEIDCDPQLAIVVIGNEDGKTQIANILGPVKDSTKPRKLIERSVYVQKIRRALKMTEPVTLRVDPARAQIVAGIAALPDAEFRVFENAYRSAIKKRPSESR